MGTETKLSRHPATCQNGTMTIPFQLWFFRLARLQRLQNEWHAAIHAYDVAMQSGDDDAADKAGEYEGRLSLACSTALNILLRTPAPDLAAAAHKLELAIEWQCEIAQLAGLLLDLRRMVKVSG